MTIDTFYDPTQHHENVCGVTMSHAMTILSVFELKNTNGTVEHKMLMIRDQRNIEFLKIKWNHNDTESWTKEFIA
mgnify:CR=1 FL=1